MSGRWSACGLWCKRHPLMVVVGLVLGGALLWYGYHFVALRQARAAADRALAAFDFDEARAQLARALSLAPRDVPLVLLAAQTARRDGDVEAAEELLRQYEELDAHSTRAVELEYALLLAQRGRVQEVVDELIAQLEIRHPAQVQILEALAGGCAQGYQLRRAAHWASELLAKAPKNAIGRLIQAQTEETIGRRDVALDTLRAVVNDYPAYRRARQHLAGLLLQTASFEEAIDHLEELRRRQPDALLPLLNLAHCWQRLDRPDQLRPLLALLERDHPDSPDVLVISGRFALKEQRFEDAERLLRRALALAPNDADVHQLLATCLRFLGREEEADSHIQRHRQIEADLIRLEKVSDAMLRAPEDLAPRLEAAQICLRNGHTAEALRWLYGVLEIAPTNPTAHQLLADHFATQGDADRAARHRRRVP